MNSRNYVDRYEQAVVAFEGRGMSGEPQKLVNQLIQNSLLQMNKDIEAMRMDYQDCEEVRDKLLSLIK